MAEKPGVLSSLLKNILFLLIILQLLPVVFAGIFKQVKKSLHPDTHIGYLKVTGIINDSSYYIKQIHKFLENDEIKALMLKINSPGGAPGASQAIFNELKKFKEKKPIVSLVEDLSASGAYYVAAASNKIISNPSSLIGSIGVRMPLGNIKRFLEFYNVSAEELQSGKFKTATSWLKERSPIELTYLQNILDDTYTQFTKDIAESRHLNLNNSSEWADGQIFTGNQALKLKLIDMHGSLTDAKKAVEELLKERGIEVVGKIKLIKPKQPTGFEKLLYGEEEENSAEMKIATFIANTFSLVQEKVAIPQAKTQLRIN